MRRRAYLNGHETPPACQFKRGRRSRMSRDLRSPRARRKADLPVRTCATCARPMVWRRKWARVWEEVRYCSAKCRRGRKAGVDDATGAGRDANGR